MVWQTLWVRRKNIDLKPQREGFLWHRMEKRARVKIISLLVLISLGVIIIAVGVLLQINNQVWTNFFIKSFPGAAMYISCIIMLQYSNTLIFFFNIMQVILFNLIFICITSLLHPLCHFIRKHAWNEMNEIKCMYEKSKLWGVVYGNEITIRSESISSY